MGAAAVTGAKETFSLPAQHPRQVPIPGRAAQGFLAWACVASSWLTPAQIAETVFDDSRPASPVALFPLGRMQDGLPGGYKLQVLVGAQCIGIEGQIQAGLSQAFVSQNVPAQCFPHSGHKEVLQVAVGRELLVTSAQLVDGPSLTRQQAAGAGAVTT